MDTIHLNESGKYVKFIYECNAFLTSLYRMDEQMINKELVILAKLYVESDLKFHESALAENKLRDVFQAAAKQECYLIVQRLRGEKQI